MLCGARLEDKEYAEGKGPHPAEICTTACTEKLDAGEDQVGDIFEKAVDSCALAGRIEIGSDPRLRELLSGVTLGSTNREISFVR